MSNARMQRLLDSYFRARREGKAINAAKAIAAAMELPNQADVYEFVRRVRIEKGIQDLMLLDPKQTWEMDHETADGWNNNPGTVRITLTTADIRMLLSSESVTHWNIDWPSIVSHWGVAIFWTDGGVQYRAFSSDWQLTETSMSM